MRPYKYAVPHYTFCLDLVSIDDSCPNQSLQDGYFPAPPLVSYQLVIYSKEEPCFSWAFVYFIDLIWVHGLPILLNGLYSITVLSLF